MKYFPMTETISDEVLNVEFKAGREIGAATLGDTCLFIKVKRKIHYIPYSDLHRAFRRVELVQAKMCCGKGNFQIENLVICNKEDSELAQIKLPGARAGIIMLEELEKRVPHIKIGKPEK